MYVYVLYYVQYNTDLVWLDQSYVWVIQMFPMNHTPSHIWSEFAGCFGRSQFQPPSIRPPFRSSHILSKPKPTKLTIKNHINRNLNDDDDVGVGFGETTGCIFTCGRWPFEHRQFFFYVDGYEKSKMPALPIR